MSGRGVFCYPIRHGNRTDVCLSRCRRFKRRLHLVDDAGNWFFFTHHGHGQWYGRAASLLPATWIDGWPIVGKPDKDGIGTMVWNPERPVMKNPEPLTVTETARGFLSRDWAWNHAPRLGQRLE